MRVGLLIYGSLEVISGGYLYDRKLVAYLLSQGDQVKVVTLPWRNYPAHLGDNLSRDLYRRLAHLDVDVLVQDELNHPSLFWLNTRLGGRVKYPLVSIVHHLRSCEEHPAVLKWIYQSIERRYLCSVHGFICNSQTTRQVVQDLLGSAKPFQVAYPGKEGAIAQVTSGEVSHRAHLPGPLQIIFVGNVIPRKGLHVLLKALACLPAEQWHLVVVGSLQADPSNARAMRRQVTRAGLERNVTFLGQVAEESLRERLLQSHLLVVPSSYEGFGIVYLEGMGYGLPAIGTDAGAAGEVITHLENGYLITPGDFHALAEHIRTLDQDRFTLEKMGLAAIRHYARHPSWDEMGRSIRGFLESVVNTDYPWLANY